MLLTNIARKSVKHVNKMYVCSLKDKNSVQQEVRSDYMKTGTVPYFFELYVQRFRFFTPVERSARKTLSSTVLMFCFQKFTHPSKTEPDG